VRPSPVVWSWRAAALGAVCAIPAAVVAAFDVTNGLAFAFGVLPAAIVGIAPRRVDRKRVVPLGGMIGLAIFLGSVVAGTPIVAVVVMFAAAVGAALLAARRSLGLVMLNLAVPMLGIGLSFDDTGESAALAILMLAGSVFTWLVSLLWPETDAPPPPAAAPAPPRRVMLDYGVRLGLAAATAAAIGFALDLDHVGWSVAAATLVMRPSADMQRLRSVGRVVSVFIGALVAAGMASLSPDAAWYSLACVLVLAGAAATRGSRWYVTPAFTTFVAISLLVYAHPGDASYRFGERVGETLGGVAVAYFFGLVVPKLRARRAAGLTRD